MSPRWTSTLVAVMAAAACASTPAAEAQNQHDMTFHTVPPCTVVDTRLAGGAFAAGEIRAYNVAGDGSFAGQGGSATGCGVPGFSNGTAQVQAVALNVIALTPAGSGNIIANAADQALTGSVVNFTTGQNVSNTAPVAVAQVPGGGDVKVQVNVNSAHVLIRVFGYYSKPVQTVHVHPVPGNPTASGTALRNAMNGITDASATKRYVIKIEPGIYDLGTTMLTQKPYVDLEGSGQEATVLRGTIDGSEAMLFGVIKTASFAEVRDLHVDCNGSDLCILVPDGAAPWIHRVTVSGSDNLFRRGIGIAGGSPRIEDVTLRFQGEYHQGIVALSVQHASILRTRIEIRDALAAEGVNIQPSAPGSSVEMRDVQIEISGESAPYGLYGIRLITSQATLVDTSVDISGGTTTTGLSFSGQDLRVINSQIRIDASNGIGIWAQGPATVEGSQIAASYRTVLSSAGQGPRIAASRLEGGPVQATSPTCAFVWDETFTPFAGPACP